jgi:hypothetical protein
MGTRAHQEAKSCLNDFGVDLNLLYGISDRIQTGACLEQTAGDRWVDPGWWIVHIGAGSVYPQGYSPRKTNPIEDFASKFVAAKVVVDAGTPAEKIHYFASADVLRTAIDTERIFPGAFGAAYPVASILPRLAPVSVGRHTHQLFLLLREQHCDGFGTDVANNCLPPGETAFGRLSEFEVAAPSIAGRHDIRMRLQTIPSLTIDEDFPLGDKYHFYRLRYRQPVDHRNPGAGSFDQRLTLLHKDAQRPMVVHTTGYSVIDFPFLAETAAVVDGNQISIEERFFGSSRPLPLDWSKLTIWQAASDHHRIVEAFSRIYPNRWLSTGSSKGGMASVYHRRFFPKDVDGTVVYATPNNVDDSEDSAYSSFFRTVGTDPDCRTSLTVLQNEVLGPRRDALRSALAELEVAGLSFDRIVGAPDRALEVLVIELPFVFWQYFGQALCPHVPSTAATNSEIIEFVDAVTGLVNYTDQFIEPVVPYFFQAGTQLGYPSPSTDQLTSLTYPGIDQPMTFVPPDVRLTFDAGAMADVDTWVKGKGSQLLFLYGARDPWSAEPFRLGVGSTDSFNFVAPEANHLLSLGTFSPADRELAIATIQRWAGVRPATIIRPHALGLEEPLTRRGRLTPSGFAARLRASGASD